jgi:hypothetical protein
MPFENASVVWEVMALLKGVGGNATCLARKPLMETLEAQIEAETARLMAQG